MVWDPELEELKRRRRLAAQMGGEEAVAKHHARGKLTVRERIDGLADPGSFQEIGSITGSASYEGSEITSFTPANCVVGTFSIDGRRTVVVGSDFTVRGGASDAAIADKVGYAERMALDQRLPYVRLLDATGGSVRTFEQIGRTYIPDNPGTAVATELLQTVPVVSAVMGSVAGLPAVWACMAHFNLMVKGTSQVFVAGPPVVRAALGQEISKEELGNDTVQVDTSGAINNAAESEQEAFQIIRRFLSYMPGNVWELPPRSEPADHPERRDEELLSIIPRERRKIYEPHEILRRVLDRDSFFEIAPAYGRSRITALARVHGHPVGAMIDDPRFLGGAMDVAAGEKMIRFVQMCDLFHLPVVYFADQPGFMIGLESEKRGIVRAGARTVAAVCSSRAPWITFVVRQLYGVAGGLHLRTSGMYRRYAWPSARWGSMHIEGGAVAAYRREIESAPDPDAKLQEIEQRLEALASPFRSADAFAVEEIIDPRDTRPLLVEFVEEAQSILNTQLGPSTGLAYWP
jgi:acetyl-CoA carboxylase carboxyltransferase component